MTTTNPKIFELDAEIQKVQGYRVYSKNHK